MTCMAENWPARGALHWFSLSGTGDCPEPQGIMMQFNKHTLKPK